MLRYLFMIFTKKVDQQKMEEELSEEHNNMTQGNDHQQILWHGNKRKKYARIVFSEQTLRMCRCKRGKL